MSVKCWASVASAGQYPFNPNQYFMLPVPACRQDALNQSWVNVGPPSVTLVHIQRGDKNDMVTQYWANVRSVTVFDRLHYINRWREMNWRLIAQTETD